VSASRLATVRLVLVTLALGLAVALIVLGLTSRPSASPGDALRENPYLDPGTALAGPAPGFTLVDQSGRRVSLRSFRGRVVLLAFNDSQCTTICPLTTTEMVDAKRMLGAAGARVQLLGVDANPTATAVSDVRAYSRAHGMMRRWRFLTGTPAQLKRVWRAYHIAVQIERGQIDHTPALYAIGPTGRLARLYQTELAYAGIEQQAQLLAREASRLLPGHPPVRSSLSYATVQPISPRSAVALPAAGTASASSAPPSSASPTTSTADTGAGTGAGTVSLGPGAPRVLLFFATWDAQTGDLGARMRALGGYGTLARTARLPALTAIDEGSVEPSPAALPRFLASLSRPLPYPVAIDASGRLADGYQVEDQPWLVLVSAAGRILWRYDVAVSGWPSATALARDVSAALAHPSPPPPRAIAAARRRLAGSPAPLAALHARSGRLIGGTGALDARLHALRGYAVVLNVWASWCAPCQAEFPLFAAASARYGRRVAFLGADVEDSAGSARSFLAAHPVSYPSYESSLDALGAITPVGNLPMTIFIGPAGRLAHVHIGQYQSQGSLDQDVESYAETGERRG
jgi:cytochrome oxidase Cu insertion factor (SCO1/SenC/PrrC family)/thiol-disulfide isomerase/thioredoxin